MSDGLYSNPEEDQGLRSFAKPLPRKNLDIKRGLKPGPKTPFDEPLVVDFAFLYLQDRISPRATGLYSEPLVVFARHVQSFITQEMGIDLKLGEDQLVNHAKRLIKAYIDHRAKAG